MCPVNTRCPVPPPRSRATHIGATLFHLVRSLPRVRDRAAAGQVLRHWLLVARWIHRLKSNQLAGEIYDQFAIRNEFRWKPCVPFRIRERMVYHAAP